ncbi:MAG: hypothetical protein ACKVXR_06160 [Planctomycetota bacterium]
MHTPPRDDRILPITRVLFGALAAIVFPFFFGLTFNPGNTAENFAWPLAPKMSALLFGTLYFAVVYSFLRVAFARLWHRVSLVLVATLPVLVALGIVSILHWEKFTNDPPRLAVWITAYLVFPPFLTLLLWLNWRRDPRTPEAGEVFVPRGLRVISLLLGFLFGAVGAALIFAPGPMADVWPWPVKPLAAQAIGALFLAPTAVQLVILREERWSALKLVAEAGILWFGAILVSIVRTFDEFDRSRPMTWIFIGFLAVEWALVVWMYVYFESKRRSRHSP